MNPCPSPDLLLQLLENRIEGVELDGIVVHIEICVTCQEHLEDLTRGEAWKSTLRELPGEPELDRAEPGWSLQSAGELTVDAPAFTGTDGVLAPSSGGGTNVASFAQAPADRDETQSRSDLPLERARVRAHEALSNRPRIPGYDILEHLGEGGMGVVYKARQVGLNRLVALKMIRGGNQVRPDHRARFSIEAEAVARLRHPNILQIFDIGEVDGMPFVSLELLEGGSLADRLDGTPQPGRASAELLQVLARAIVAAHEAGIVHRDLKPSNVLFAADGVPKVTDFGLAKRMESDSRQTETGVVMGSPSYMAPEQARGHTKDVGPAADIYALGAILYEMLTGRPPFKGETPMETVRQVIFEDVVNPSQLIPRVSRDLETICLKCLNKEPAKRYKTTGELADDLERFLKGETVLARRTPAIERGIKWARRRPARALALGTVVVAIPILALGIAILEHNRRIADGERSGRDFTLSRDGNRLTVRAKDAKSADEISQLRDDMSAFLAALTETDKRRLGTLPAEIESAFKDLKVLEEKQNNARAARLQFQSFLDLRAQSQLAAAEFELDPSNRRERLGGTVRKALRAYARIPGAADQDWQIQDPLPTALAEGEPQRVIDGCYDLLLVLSETIDPDRGLKVLDRAAQLRRSSTAAYHLRRARCLEKAGDSAGRDRELSLAAKQPIVTSLDHFLIGREHLAKRDWNQAIASLEMALRLEPEQVAAQLLLAVCEYNSEPRRLREARNNISACLGRHPELLELYLLRARIQGEEGNQMLAQIEPGRAGPSDSVRKRANAAFDAALADYQSALERITSDDFRYVLLVNRGGLFLQAGRLAESGADLAAAISLKPELYQAHSTLGQLYGRQGRLDEAFDAYGKAMKRAADPTTQAALHRTRALLYSDRRDVSPEKRAAALADLERAIRLEPGNERQRAGDTVERARIFFSAAQFDEALRACGEALELVPSHIGAHQMRISTLVAMKRFDDVLSSCDAYLARAKPTVEVLEIRGLARVARQNYSGAIADYTRALDLVSDADSAVRSRVLNRRGWAYHFADATRLALDDFEASLRLDKNQSDVLAGRGLARVRLGQWRDAVADAEAAVKLVRGSSERIGSSDDRAQADFNAARIYAQAVEFAAGEVSREGERAVSLYRSYRARALELLEHALRQVADPGRRKEILSDPALKPLRIAPVRSVSRITSKPALDHDDR